MNALRFSLAAMACATGLLWQAAIALAQPIAEHELTAAYVFNLAQLTDWPPSANSGRGAPFTICVLGRSAAGRGLEALEAKVIHGHRVELRAVAGAEGAKGCNLLYISAPERVAVLGIVAALGNAPVLTVADPDAAGATAAAVTLVRRDARIGFHVNLATAKRAQLRLSSRLLQLALSVTEER